MSPQKFDYLWVVAYISRDKIDTVEEDLMELGLGSIRVYIPTVRILKKQFKNKNVYEYVPLLFNYGFFQIPYDKACDVEFLKNLRKEVPAIYAWVQDPSKLIKQKPNLRMDNKCTEEEEEEPVDENGIKILQKPEEFPHVATATEEEMVALLKSAEDHSVFSDGLVERLQEGDFLTLRGYPYEGMTAEVVDVNESKKTVKVRLLLETMITTAVVSFENIFYTVYSDFDKSCKEQSLDEINFKGKRNLDRLYAQISYDTEE